MTVEEFARIYLNSIQEDTCLVEIYRGRDGKFSYKSCDLRYTSVGTLLVPKEMAKIACEELDVREVNGIVLNRVQEAAIVQQVMEEHADKPKDHVIFLTEKGLYTTMQDSRPCLGSIVMTKRVAEALCTEINKRLVTGALQ